MDIRNWPLDRIMQLPDCAFGRRWPVVCGEITEIDVDHFCIVQTGIPDKAVIHEILVTGMGAITQALLFELAWADQLPATGVAWSELQKMFPCQGVKDGLDYNIYFNGGGPWHVTKLRLPSPAAGQRPALRVDGSSTAASIVCVTFVVSSLPTEVPDWLISGPARSL